MRGRVALGVSTLALLVGFAAAPFTHAHPLGHGLAGDGHHGPAPTRHVHLAPHGPSPDHAHESVDESSGDDHEGSTTDVVAADDFVFQPVAGPAWPVPAVLTAVVTLDDRTSVWLGASLPGPPVHGPPSNTPSAPRAPPVLPPAML